MSYGAKKLQEGPLCSSNALFLQAKKLKDCLSFEKSGKEELTFPVSTVPKKTKDLWHFGISSILQAYKILFSTGPAPSYS